jgi:hypothetical protein
MMVVVFAASIHQPSIQFTTPLDKNSQVVVEERDVDVDDQQQDLGPEAEQGHPGHCCDQSTPTSLSSSGTTGSAGSGRW